MLETNTWKISLTPALPVAVRSLMLSSIAQPTKCEEAKKEEVLTMAMNRTNQQHCACTVSSVEYPKTSQSVFLVGWVAVQMIAVFSDTYRHCQTRVSSAKVSQTKLGFGVHSGECKSMVFPRGLFVFVYLLRSTIFELSSVLWTTCPSVRPSRFYDTVLVAYSIRDDRTRGTDRVAFYYCIHHSF